VAPARRDAGSGGCRSAVHGGGGPDGAQGHDRRTDEGQGRGLWRNLVGRQRERVSGVRGGAPAWRRPQDQGVSLCRDTAGGGREQDRRNIVRPVPVGGGWRLSPALRGSARLSVRLAPSPP